MIWSTKDLEKCYMEEGWKFILYNNSLIEFREYCYKRHQETATSNLLEIVKEYK
jgi:hypothetical protein